MADYQASVAPEPLPGRPNPRFPDEVSPASTGFAVGKGLEDAGNVASQVYEKTQAQARQTQVADANNQLQTVMLGLTHDPKTGAFTKQGKDAFNLGQQYLPQYEAASTAIVNSIPDARARQAAQMMADHVRGQLTEQLDSHELQQHEKYAVQTQQASVRIAQQQAAANYNHADILASNHDTIGYSIDGLAKQQGWSDEQTQEAKQEAYSGMHTGVIDRMLADDKYQMAKHYLDAVKNEMAPSTVESAARTIEAHLKEKQNEAKQDIADRFQDSMTAAQFGLNNPVSVSRKEMDILFPKDAGRRWDGLQSMVAAGAQAKEYNQMTIPQIKADLESSKPTEGGPEAAFKIKGYEIRAHAAEQSIVARQKDPAQFAIDSGSGWKALDFSNPKAALAQLSSRANSAPDISEQVGIPVSLLTKNESAQLGSALTNAKPANRLATLNALHQALPDERAYFEVLRQVMPHSPVTAIVGAKVGTPDPMHTPVWYDSKFGPDPADAAKILTGEQLLNPPQKGDQEKGGFKQGFPMPSEAGGAGLQSYFSRQANDVFRDRPELADAHYTAFRAAYAALASENGDLSGVPNKSLMDKAFKMAVGTTREFNGGYVSVPAGMDPTRFTGLVENAVTAAANNMGAPPDWKNRMGGYRLREMEGTALGSGLYELTNGNVPLARPDGKGKFIIDVKSMYFPGRAHGSPEDIARASVAKQ